MFFAHWVYHHPHFIKTKATNHGQLIIPPVSIALFSIKNAENELLDDTLPNKNKLKPASQKTTNAKWMLLLFYPDRCDAVCIRQLYYLRQIQTATGKDQNRVERALLTYHVTQPSFFHTRLLSVNPHDFQTLFLEKIHLSHALTPGTLYLVDPMGYIMMAYRPNANPEDILKDLKHLLTISQIG